MPATGDKQELSQKIMSSASSGYPDTEKQLKVRGRGPGAFIALSCLDTSMKHEARVFYDFSRKQY